MEVLTMEKITSFLAHENYVLALQFMSGNKTLISGGMDRMIKLWSVSDWSLVKSVQGHDNSVHAMSMTGDEKLLATGSTDCMVKLWSVPQMDLLYTVRDRKKTVAEVSFSPDGQWVAAVSYGGRVAIWSIKAEPMVAFAASQKNLVSVAFSPDGRLLAVSGLGDEISIWQLPDGEPVDMRQLGEYEEALTAFTKAGEADRAGTIPSWNIDFSQAGLYAELGEVAIARALAEQALESAPPDIAAQIEAFLEELDQE